MYDILNSHVMYVRSVRSRCWRQCAAGASASVSRWSQRRTFASPLRTRGSPLGYHRLILSSLTKLRTSNRTLIPACRANSSVVIWRDTYPRRAYCYALSVALRRKWTWRSPATWASCSACRSSSAIRVPSASSASPAAASPRTRRTNSVPHRTAHTYTIYCAHTVRVHVQYALVTCRVVTRSTIRMVRSTLDWSNQLHYW